MDAFTIVAANVRRDFDLFFGGVLGDGDDDLGVPRSLLLLRSKFGVGLLAVALCCRG